MDHSAYHWTTLPSKLFIVSQFQVLSLGCNIALVPGTDSRCASVCNVNGEEVSAWWRHFRATRVVMHLMNDLGSRYTAAPTPRLQHVYNSCHPITVQLTRCRRGAVSATSRIAIFRRHWILREWVGVNAPNLLFRSIVYRLSCEKIIDSVYGKNTTHVERDQSQAGSNKIRKRNFEQSVGDAGKFYRIILTTNPCYRKENRAKPQSIRISS